MVERLFGSKAGSARIDWGALAAGLVIVAGATVFLVEREMRALDDLLASGGVSASGGTAVSLVPRELCNPAGLCYRDTDGDGYADMRIDGSTAESAPAGQSMHDLAGNGFG